MDDAISKQSWERLRVLFLGGGGPFLACPDEGGLASGCDASQVPLDLLMRSQVAEKLCLVSTLLELGAHVDGLPLCEKPPLLVALENEEFAIANELIEAGADVACALNQPHLQTKVVKLNFDLIIFVIYTHSMERHWKFQRVGWVQRKPVISILAQKSFPLDSQNLFLPVHP